jgi:negative regulator of replication initiation
MSNEITAKDIKRLLLKVYKKLQTGEISEVRAYRESYILNSLLKAVEITDLEDKLKNIEGLLQSGEELNV